MVAYLFNIAMLSTVLISWIVFKKFRNNEMSLKKTVIINKEFQKKDRYSFLPGSIAVILFFSFFWIYSNYGTLIFLGGILYAIVIGAIGSVKLIMKRFKSGISHITPAALFLTLLLSPSLHNFRNYVGDMRHKIRFKLEKSKYETEARAMQENGIIYKKWDWGNSDGTSIYTLVYDALDKTERDSEQFDKEDPCSRTALKLETHFYIIDDFCP